MIYTQSLSTTEEILKEARTGRMFILVDDENRENEGDLVIPAQMVTPATINFMAKNGRGLICLAITHKRAEQLGLHLMRERSSDPLYQHKRSTAFTISIEAREGVTTGISAPDRARTIAVAIDPTKSKEAIVSPGHIFPLVACDGGVLVRTGHTEAAVDIARLAGLNPSGVICEIMNDDGTMARLPELITFARRHSLLVGRIADLIIYRRKTEKLIERVIETNCNSIFGGVWNVITYYGEIDCVEYITLVKGSPFTIAPSMVYVHTLNILEDVLGDRSNGRRSTLHSAMRAVATYGRGVIIVPRGQKMVESDQIASFSSAKSGSLLISELSRDSSISAQILIDLGVQDVIVLTGNSSKLVTNLACYGVTVIEQRLIVSSFEKK